MIPCGNNKLFCKNCGCVENADAAILRSAEEIRLLFPDITITTNLMYEWCGVIGSKKKIRRVLNEHYKMKGNYRWAFFE
jgi:hypothetical protein